MVLQPARRTAEEHCCPRGGLLPRLFTLTLALKGMSKDFSLPLPRQGGYSLLRYYTLTDIESLARAVLCVARTFLPLRSAGSDRATLL